MDENAPGLQVQKVESGKGKRLVEDAVFAGPRLLLAIAIVGLVVLVAVAVVSIASVVASESPSVFVIVVPSTVAPKCTAAIVLLVVITSQREVADVGNRPITLVRLPCDGDAHFRPGGKVVLATHKEAAECGGNTGDVNVHLVLGAGAGRIQPNANVTRRVRNRQVSHASKGHERQLLVRFVSQAPGQVPDVLQFVRQHLSIFDASDRPVHRFAARHEQVMTRVRRKGAEERVLLVLCLVAAIPLRALQRTLLALEVVASDLSPQQAGLAVIGRRRVVASTLEVRQLAPLLEKWVGDAGTALHGGGHRVVHSLG